MDPLLGRRIAGKYEIDAFVKAGAMGAVYRGRHVSLERVVGVKVVHPSLAGDPRVAARFHREARAASRLDHPNSVRILDYGQEPDGLLYIVMEYLVGRDLLDIIADEWPLAPERVVEILSQTLAALAVAHERGILHRDLKPENIMVVPTHTDDGTSVEVVKVCDFGIAKIAERDHDPQPHRHATGNLVIGTPEYMSPEQAQAGDVDARSDIYSVGILLYHLLAGALPFDGDAPLSIALRQIHELPKPPSRIADDVDPVLEAICLRALKKKPIDRWQNAREMRSALRSALGERPSQTHALPLEASSRATSPTLLEVPTRSRWRSGRVMLAALVSMAAGAAVVHTSTDLLADVGPPLASIPRSAVVESAHAIPVPAVVREYEIATAPAPTPIVERVALSTPPRALPRRFVSRPASPDAVAAQPIEAPPVEAAPPPTPAPAATPAPFPIPDPEPPTPPGPPTEPPAPTVTHARVDIGTVTNSVGAPGTAFQRTLAPTAPKIVACYREAIPRVGPHTSGEGSGVLHVETNDTGMIARAQLDGALHAELGACIARAVIGARVPNVDTGAAHADLPLVYHLR